MSEASAIDQTTLDQTTLDNEAATPTAGAVPFANAIPGVPWVVAMFVGAAVSYVGLRALFDALDVGPTPLMSIGTMLIGAAIATAFALAAYKPFDRISGRAARSTLIMAVSLVLSFAFWTLFSGVYNHDMVVWSFPIIATAWWYIAATSFVGEDAHLAQLSPGRRTALNAVLWIAGTWLVLRTFVWIPPFWFGFIQTLLVTGGFAYLLRGVRQPAKSFYAWAILALLTGIAIVVSSWLNVWDPSAKVGAWAIGGPTATWGIFFALWCGTNYGVLASLQCWPFSRVRQPWGTSLAVLGVVAWCALLTLLLRAVFGAIYATEDTALLEAQVYGWHLVFWSFCFPLIWGVGSSPYLWAGQRTPGTWETVEA
ncbi:MAG TPA: hypothetical protein VFA46_16010 [Actinomycetes bacterium]|jgi:hypothetical protein|nr:hypothetical protein [Actinomycetes bacterium]